MTLWLEESPADRQVVSWRLTESVSESCQEGHPSFIKAPQNSRKSLSPLSYYLSSLSFEEKSDLER